MNFKIVPNNLLWSKNPPLWSPASLGSADHIEEGELIAKNLRSFSRNELELVSEIGGLRFFDLMAQVDFCKITLFDRNINDVKVVIKAINFIESTDFEGFDGFEAIQKDILDNPGAFYLPSCLRGEVELEMGVNWDVSNTNFKWTPTKEVYNTVRGRLNRIQSNIYLDFPPIDAEGRKVVVFLPNSDIKPIIDNASLIIPVYTRKVDNPKLSTKLLREIAIGDGKSKKKRKR